MVKGRLTGEEWTASLRITYNYASRPFAKYNSQLQVGFWHVLFSRITIAQDSALWAIKSLIVILQPGSKITLLRFESNHAYL